MAQTVVPSWAHMSQQINYLVGDRDIERWEMWIFGWNIRQKEPNGVRLYSLFTIYLFFCSYITHIKNTHTEIKSTASLGTNACRAKAKSTVPLPENIPQGCWSVTDGNNFNPQPGLIVRVEEHLQQELASMANQAQPVRISGAVGVNSAAVNGVYDHTGR